MFLNHAINTSAIIVGRAAAKLDAPHMLAVKFDTDGAIALPSAGDLCIGIVLADTETVEAGEEVHVQIKDITHWRAGGTFKKGDLLAAAATGKAVKATAGQSALAIALQDGADGDIVECVICRITAA